MTPVRLIANLLLSLALLAGLTLPASASRQTAAPAPRPASSALSGITAAAGGWHHTCALTSSGGVKCWGSNASGQLGTGDTADHLTPTDVPGLTSGVTALAAGWSFTCALTASGGVKCWGDNSKNQLGDDTSANRLAPVDVYGLTGGVQAISAQANHACALTTGGGVKCWGYNVSGQLGDGSTTNRARPVDVSGLSGGVSAISAGSSHTCALAGGGLKCWGENQHGQLGDGSTTDHLIPADVPSLTSGVSALEAGGDHTCALTDTGGLKCWGYNLFGQIGDNSSTNRLAPVDVSGLTGGVAAVAAGTAHTCALTSAGAVQCWGEGQYGQVGNGSTSVKWIPTAVSGLSSGVSGLYAGWNFTCALLGSGLKCWGENQYGQLGGGSTSVESAPVEPLGLGSGVTALGAGLYHTCAASAGGPLCWGRNTAGQLGDNSTLSRAAPAAVSVPEGAVILAGGNNHTCAINPYGFVYCWGYNGSGQLGDSSNTQRLTPVELYSIAGGASALAAGGDHTCAVVLGALKCWGNNANGQLGNATTTSRNSPLGVTGLSSGVTAVTAGASHTCALTSAGAVKCWGANSYGQLGDNSTTQRTVPVAVSGLTSGVTAIAAGTNHTCALTSGGVVKCWGRNNLGQLGDGSTDNTRLAPVDVSGLPAGITGLAAGGAHTCALTASGGALCWGWNLYGQLGGGTLSTQSLTPLAVSGLSGAAALAAGNTHTCARTSSGALKCWGNNSNGQLGHRSPLWVPVEVVDSAAAKYSISGQVTDVLGAPAAGVSLSDGAGHTALTGSDGAYTFSGLDAGSYTLTPSKAGAAFGPASSTVNLSASASGVDFSLYPCGAPSGLNLCDLQAGDVLVEAEQGGIISDQTFINIGGSYFTHAALYIGMQPDPAQPGLWRPAIAEAQGLGDPGDEDDLREISLLETTFWKGSSHLIDWAVARPDVSAAVRESAIAYARAKAAQPGVSYWACENAQVCGVLPMVPLDLAREDRFYCSGLVWKAYQQAGVDIKKRVGLSQYLTSGWIMPDDLFFGSPVVQSKPGANRRVARIFSPAHLTLVDDLGRRTGYDPATGGALNEIPGTFYSGTASLIEAVHINTAANIESWRLVLTGFDTGAYHVEIGPLRPDAPLAVIPGSITPGEIRSYPLVTRLYLPLLR